MKVTLTIYSEVRRHRAERALSIAYCGPWSFSISIWEWDWAFGFGERGEDTFIGPFFSYMKASENYPSYWTAALSANLWWNSA